MIVLIDRCCCAHCWRTHFESASGRSPRTPNESGGIAVPQAVSMIRRRVAGCPARRRSGVCVGLVQSAFMAATSRVARRSPDIRSPWRSPGYGLDVGRDMDILSVVDGNSLPLRRRVVHSSRQRLPRMAYQPPSGRSKVLLSPTPDDDGRAGRPHAPTTASLCSLCELTHGTVGRGRRW